MSRPEPTLRALRPGPRQGVSGQFLSRRSSGRKAGGYRIAFAVELILYSAAAVGYRELEAEDIDQALAFAAANLDDEIVDLRHVS